jgi:hypothetical protein
MLQLGIMSSLCKKSHNRSVAGPMGLPMVCADQLETWLLDLLNSGATQSQKPPFLRQVPYSPKNPRPSSVP